MLNAVRIWIFLSTLLVAAGWILSVLRQLNWIGYATVFGLATLVAYWRWPKNQKRLQARFHSAGGKVRRRFARSAPLLYLVLIVLTLLAGLLYAPSNGSSTAYRIPRVMHWLAAEHWHWIRAVDIRINIAGCGFEWLTAPLILLTHTDRLLFLPNWFSFLLLPGLIFSVFTRLGVRPRVAWWWMWLLPSGWCFIMQANSTINDAFAAAYALAAVDLALRGRETKNIGDLWLAMLAAALATGVKQTDILLALPGLIALAPSMRMLLQRSLASSTIAVLCLFVSALPMMVLNWQHTGSWSGVSTEAWAKAELNSPFWGVIGNVFCLAAQNLKPPVFPFVQSWNVTRDHFLQTGFGAHFAGFEDFGRLSFGVSETSAGIGLGISFLILLSLCAARLCRRIPEPTSTAISLNPLLRLLRWTPWLLLLVFMAKVGTFENGRQLAAYYILLFPLLLAYPGQSVVVRYRWWKSLAQLVMASSVMLVVISRDRPLFPAQTILGQLRARHPDSKLVDSIVRTYSETPAFEAKRRFLRNNLPSDEKVLGYATHGGGSESLLWLPYGRRRIQIIVPEDTPEQLLADGIHFVVVEDELLRQFNDTLPQWLARYHGTLVKQWEFIGNPYAPPERCYLVRLQGQ